MRRSAALYGILGLVLLAFGLVEWYFTSGFESFIVINLVGGVFCVAMWMSSSWSTVGSFIGRRSTRYGANALLYSLTFILILVAVNYLASLHHTRLDLTAERVYSLSDQSVKIVEGLAKPLKIYGFFRGGEDPTARRLYEEYAYASRKVSFEIVDPDRHPEIAEKYKVMSNRTTHLQYGDDRGESTNVTELTEDAITNGIIRVSKGKKKVVCFLDGHGEADPDDAAGDSGLGQLQTALEGEGFTAKKVLLATEAAVPADCTILAIFGPKRPLAPHETDAFNAYLKHGGRALVTFRAPRPGNEVDEAALAGLVAQWGVKAGNNVVVDQVLRLFAGPELGLDPLVSDYGTHPVTHGFNQRTVFPMARSVAAASDLKLGLTVTSLAQTSGTSWAETDIEGIFKRQEAKLDSADVRGPIDVAQAVEADLEKLGWGSGKARLVIFGSTEFADNHWLRSQFFNRDFLANSADWLAGEESLISIRSRSLRASRINLTLDQSAIVFALSVLLMPELLLIMGLVVWWERRN